MIITLEETKEWLREDSEDPKVLNQIQMLIGAAEKYLINASGNVFTSSNELAKLFCFVLVADWYENREMIGQASGKVRVVVESMLAQLSYAMPNVPTGLTATAGDSLVGLAWATNSEIGIAGYNVYQNDVKIATTSEPIYQVTGLINNTAYAFSVSAVDKAGNESGLSATVSVTPTLI